MHQHIVVGTSSWSDPGFVDEWYPPQLPARKRLEWYARHFAAVEVNSTFYAIPSHDTVARWVEQTPEGFTFNVKCHRLLSRHFASLDSLPPDLRGRAETSDRGRVALTNGLEQALCERLLEATEPLASSGKLGSFLIQLTPAFSPVRHSLTELTDVCEQLGPGRVACELRHRGWVSDDRIEATHEFFDTRGICFVCVDAPPGDHIPIMPAIDWVTQPRLAYMRIHGRNTHGYLHGKTVAERFAYRYSEPELAEIATRASGLADRAEQVQVMFNNNRGDDAPTAASAFRRLLGQAGQTTADDQLTLGDTGGQSS